MLRFVAKPPSENDLTCERPVVPTKALQGIVFVLPSLSNFLSSDGDAEIFAVGIGIIQRKHKTRWARSPGGLRRIFLDLGKAVLGIAALIITRAFPSLLRWFSGIRLYSCNGGPHVPYCI